MHACRSTLEDPTIRKSHEKNSKDALAALAAMGLRGPQGASSTVFGNESGINAALSGLNAASMADVGGGGTRSGGACEGCTGVGIGELGPGLRQGPTDFIADGIVHRTMTIVHEREDVRGGLDRGEIQRVVDRAMGQIKFCYERELSKDPNLEGKLVPSWTIGPDGRVTTLRASQNTFSSSSSRPVEDCVLRVVKRMQFPNPRGGGEVFVTYPFVFSAR